MVIIFISVLLYCILFAMNKKIGFIYYQLFVASVYLFSLSYIQTLDLTLVIYVIFAILPYVRNFKVSSFMQIFFLLYFILNLIISISFNGIKSAISVFIIRLAGLVLFYFLFDNIPLDSSIIKDKSVNLKCIISILICELIILFIGMSLSTDGRLMLNFQCTVGCIATSVIFFFLIVCLLLKNIRLLL